MITEMRIYTTHPGMSAAYAQLYKESGLPVQLAHGARLKAFYRTDVGDPNRVILIWEYDSYEDRLAFREELFAQATWLDFIKEAAPLVQREENMFLTDVVFD